MSWGKINFYLLSLFVIGFAGSASFCLMELMLGGDKEMIDTGIFWTIISGFGVIMVLAMVVPIDTPNPSEK
ncbi:MAG: hypothetical protein AAB534_00725 [Patescibacteria group bacterium]